MIEQYLSVQDTIGIAMIIAMIGVTIIKLAQFYYFDKRLIK